MSVGTGEGGCDEWWSEQNNSMKEPGHRAPVSRPVLLPRAPYFFYGTATNKIFIPSAKRCTSFEYGEIF